MNFSFAIIVIMNLSTPRLDHCIIIAVTLNLSLLPVDLGTTTSSTVHLLRADLVS